MIEDKYTVKVEKDPETGDLVMPLPVELLNQLGWDIGDELIWDELPGKAYSLRKKEKENG